PELDRVNLVAGETEIESLQMNYSSVKKGDLLFLIGSLGLVEISVREGSAFERLSLKPGE
ncbi:unnamed protein product, partial [marine sediment metagenome]